MAEVAGGLRGPLWRLRGRKFGTTRRATPLRPVAVEATAHPGTGKVPEAGPAGYPMAEAAALCAGAGQAPSNPQRVHREPDLPAIQPGTMAKVVE